MYEIISLSSGFILWAMSCWLLYTIGYHAGRRAGVIGEIRRKLEAVAEELNGR